MPAAARIELVRIRVKAASAIDLTSMCPESDDEARGGRCYRCIVLTMRSICLTCGRSCPASHRA